MKAFEMKDGDIYPDRLVEDVYAIKANLTARLSIIKGEYKSNVLFGLPLGATKEETDLNVQKVILGTNGVTGITTFSSSMVNKVYKCTFTAETVYGRILYE